MVGCWVIALKRCLMFQAAEQVGIAPLRLGNTCTLKVLRLSFLCFRMPPPEQLPFFGHG